MDKNKKGGFNILQTRNFYSQGKYFIVLGIVLLTAILGTIVVNFNNFKLARAGVNCSAGSWDGSNCVERTGKLSATTYQCPNGTQADGNNNCNSSQNYLWRCDGRAGEVFLVGGDWAGGQVLNVCTSSNLAGNFLAKVCQYSYPLFDNASGNQYTRADRFNAAFNYDPGYTDYASGGYNGQSASGASFCMDGQGCPAGMRTIFGEASKRYGTDGGAYGSNMQLLCVNISLIGTTNPSSPIFTIAGGRDGSYIADRKCGDNPGGGTAPLSGYDGSITIAGDQYGNNHEEVVWLCSRAAYSAPYSSTSQYCPDGFSDGGADCYRVTGINSFTIDNTVVGSGTCTPSQTIQGTNITSCTFPLSGGYPSYVIPPTGLYSGIRNENGNADTYLGNSDLCQVNGASLVCNNIPVPVNTAVGDRELILHEPNVAFYSAKGIITVNPLGATIAGVNISNGICTPNPALSGASDLNCSFGLTGNSYNLYQLPANGIIASTPAGASAACSITDNGQQNVALSCPNVLAGNTPGSVTATPTGDGITNPGTASFVVNPTATVIADANIGTCSPKPTTVQGSPVNCTFPLTGGQGVYTLPAENLYSGILNENGNTATYAGNSDLCQINGTSLICNNIPVPANTAVGDREVVIHRPNEAFYPGKGLVAVNALAATIRGTNIKNGACTPNPSSVGSTNINCEFPLQGNSYNLYQLPDGGITANTPAGASAACSITANGQQNVTLSCSGVFAGNATGNITATPTGTGVSNPGNASFLVNAVATTISSTNLLTGACNPATVISGSAVDSCNYNLTGNIYNFYNLPATAITALVPGSTVSDSCVILNNQSINVVLSCPNLPTIGATVDSKLVATSLSSLPADTLTITNLPPTVITGASILAGLCNPDTVVINYANAKCVYPLTGDPNNDYILPVGGITADTTTGSSLACTVLNNGDANASLSCDKVKPGNTAGSVIVTPTGTNISSPGSATITVTAIPPTSLTSGNIADSSNCTQNLIVSIPNTYDCNFKLSGDPNNSYAIPEGGINAYTSSDAGSIVFLAKNNSLPCAILQNQTPNANLVCTKIATSGATAGIKNVLLTFNGLNPVDKGDVGLISEISSSDIPDLAISCNDGQPVLINSKTSCIFTLPNGKTLPESFKLGISDSIPSGSCIVSELTQVVNCKDVPVGSQSGLQTIFGQIGNDPKVDSGEKISVYAPDPIRSGGNYTPTIIVLSVISLGSGALMYYSRRRLMKIAMR